MPASPVLNRLVRVRLRENISAIRIASEGLFDVIDPDAGAMLAEARDRIGAVTFRPEGIGLPDLGLSMDVYRLDLVPHGGGRLGIDRSGEVEWYPGVLRLVAQAGGGAVVNAVDIEDYLPGVVASELDRRFHRETFRAQAIVARTFAWYQMRTTGKRRFYDVTAGEGSQVYGPAGKLAEVPQAARAVLDTAGLVCTWASPVGDRIFCTYYSSACGGWTQSATAVSPAVPEPPLMGCVFCPFCESTDRFDWGPLRLPKLEIAGALARRYERFAALGPIARVEVRQATPVGRPLVVAVVDADGREERLSVETFRLTLDPTGRQVRSSYFSIEDRGDSVILAGGRGFGHGVGLCQHGAEALARQGRTAAEILRHYFPGSKLRRAY